MTTSLIMLLVALVLPYVVGPVLIRTRPGIKARRCFVQVTDEAARLHFPPQSFRAIAQLEEMGFSFITHLISGDEITRVNSTLSLLVNRSSNTIALVCRAFTSNRTVNKSIEFVAFSTEFADGSEIGTSNSPIAGVFGKVPRRVRLHIPQLRDVCRLYFVHSYYVTKRTDSTPILPASGDEIEHFESTYERDFRERESLGYFYFNAKTDRYRYTWLSAIIFTWRLLWPVKPILLLRKKRRGRLIAKSAGISNL